MRGTLIVCADYESLSREAAERVAAVLAAEAERQSRVTVALAGGATPRRLYELLASDAFRARVPWIKIHFFWGDERLVPPDHPESNYRLAREALLGRVPVPPANVHAVAGQLPPEQAALSYEQELRTFFRLRRGLPAFDLLLLGVGAEGHTAALFPGAPLSQLVAGEERLVMVAHGPDAMPRLTFTLPVLNAARRIYFLVAGEEKAAAVAWAVEGKGALPVQQVMTAGELLWLLDSEAASQLKAVRVAR